MLFGVTSVVGVVAVISSITGGIGGDGSEMGPATLTSIVLLTGAKGSSVNEPPKPSFEGTSTGALGEIMHVYRRQYLLLNLSD